MDRKLCDKDAKCPFFRSHWGAGITCEGMIDGTTENITFGKGTSKKLHYDLYCCYKYKECQRHELLMRKYGEE